MVHRLVVSFRGVVAPEPDGGERYLERALALRKRAGALGASLCAWSAQTFSFDFDPGELEEAVTLAALVFEEAPDAPRFGAGIAEGEMRVVGEGGSLAALSWGPPLVAAVLLSRNARGGEVLLDEDLILRREAELSALEVSGHRVIIDPVQRRLSLHARAESTPPPSAPIPPIPPPPPPPRISIPPEPVPEQGAQLDSGRARRAPTLLPPARRDSPLRALTDSAPPAPRSADSPRPLLPEIVPPLPAPPRRREPTLPEISLGGDSPVELAKRALMQGDVVAVERLMVQLRETGEHGDLVERMTGLVALRRGATAEALRRLRDAAEAVKEPAQQARARLAYGVALATAGRTESALLEALDALARARAASDAQGERACALFLARLSASAGHPDAASVWAMIAARCAEPG